jgi:hypothetical protein
MSGPFRAQTTLDFAVGMGIFLLALAFVLSFIPTVFDPFTTGSSANLVVADRAASILARDVLAPSTAGTGTLNTGCVVAFATGNQSLANEACASSPDVDDHGGVLSLDGRNLNVSIHAPNGTADDPAEIEWEGNTVSLTWNNSGSVPNDLAVAVRTVRIDGHQYRLTVQVW